MSKKDIDTSEIEIQTTFNEDDISELLEGGELDENKDK